MRHYEIVFLVHPDQSDQTQSVLNKFSSIVKESGGTVHPKLLVQEFLGREPNMDAFIASLGIQKN